MNIDEAYNIVRTLSSGKGLNSFPDVKSIEDLKDVAFYATRTILLRKERFENSSDGDKKVILAHELGHHFESDIKTMNPSFRDLGSEVIADWFVAHIGLKEELKRYRSSGDKPYGDRFNEIIDKYQDIDKFAEDIGIWHMQRVYKF